MPAPSVHVLQLDPADPPGRLAAWFADAGVHVTVVDVGAGEPVPEVGGDAGVRGLVVLGGPMGHADDVRSPFLPAVRAALRDAVTEQVPTLAICLGAQLLAATHGGRVIVNPDGPELGAQLIAKRTNAATDPLFRELPIAPDVIQWHYDTITLLPPGGIHLASSPQSEFQAFRLGRLAWGVQFHLETTPEIVEGWARADAGSLDGYDLDLIVRRAVAVHPDVEEVWAPFIGRFADVLRDPDAVEASSAVRVSTAEPVTDPAAIRAALAAELNAARAPMPGQPNPLGMPTVRRSDD